MVEQLQRCPPRSKSQPRPHYSHTRLKNGNKSTQENLRRQVWDTLERICGKSMRYTALGTGAADDALTNMTHHVARHDETCRQGTMESTMGGMYASCRASCRASNPTQGNTFKPHHPQVSTVNQGASFDTTSSTVRFSSCELTGLLNINTCLHTAHLVPSPPPPPPTTHTGIRAHMQHERELNREGGKLFSIRVPRPHLRHEREVHREQGRLLALFAPHRAIQCRPPGCLIWSYQSYTQTLSTRARSATGAVDVGVCGGRQLVVHHTPACVSTGAGSWWCITHLGVAQSIQAVRDL
eukprot:1139142-Pelagomonas_calceolata.AAC.3